MPRSKKDVKKVLLQKGFSLSPGDHEYFFVYRNGQKTAVNTKISRGSQKDIPNGLLKTMMKQMRLEKNDFERYFNCTMSKDEYIQYLLDHKYIDC
ncbi:MAG: type II toxin-antitoxin system HicA family toxin [Bacilli bacterium]